MDEIEVWLNRIGFAQYIPDFVDNGIDGDLLKHLTNDDLKDLGISRLGDRKKILLAIEGLNSEKNLSVNEQEAVHIAQ